MYELKEKSYPMQPRERLELLGEEYLSDVELLAILLRTGRKKYSSLNLALELLQHFGTLDNFRKASISELKEISGIGQTKDIELRAMIELGKRIQTTTRKRYGQVLSSKEYGMSLAFEMQNFEQEHLTATYLDGQNQIIEKKTIFIGAVNHATASPREILYHAVKNLSVGLLVAHNHPSGNLQPSQADKIFTKKIKNACDNIGINFIDHIIVGAGNYYSFRERDSNLF